MTWIVFLWSLILSSSFAGIYNGGLYSPEKIKEAVDAKGLGPNLDPTVEGERFKGAPLGRPIFLLGDNKRCYRGNFAKTGEQISLIVYYQSPVSAEHCVYQSEFNPKPSGYALHVGGGGRCLPSSADLEGDYFDWTIRDEGPAVPLQECFVRTESYGENMDRKHLLRSESKPVEDVKPLEKQIVKEPQNIVDAAPSQELLPHREPASTEPIFTLQLSSHLSRNEAEAELQALKARGVEEGYIVEAEVTGRTRFRVCVGHFGTAKDTREFQTKLVQTGLGKDSFVQKLSHKEIDFLKFND